MSVRRAAPKHLGIAVAAAALLAASCAVGPDFVHPALPSVHEYAPETADDVASGVVPAVRYLDASTVPADWWRMLGSNEIDGIVAQALANSPTLASAQATLRQSENARRAGYGVFMPQVGVQVAGSRQRSNPLLDGSAAPSSIFNLFTLTGTVSYVLDLFGAERRRVEALGAEVDYARESARAAYLTLTANVVNAAIARAAYAEEIVANRELIAAAVAQLDLAQVQFAAGTASYASVAALQAQVAALKATLPPLLQHEEQSAHLLSMLAGRAPGEWVPPVVPFDSLAAPTDLPLVVPSDLVRQRPDIRAAEAQLHEASATVGVATASLFPAISLSGELGSAANRWAGLPSPQGKFWSGGVDVSQPVFQGGTLWYTRRAALDAQASLQNYRGVVLQAFDQVAESLRALEHDGEAVAANAEADRAAREAFELAQTNYEAGTADYLAVLIALQQSQAARLGYIQAKAQRMQDTVALLVALGGDWAAQPRQVIEGQR